MLTVESIRNITREQWRPLEAKDSPFFDYEFLRALEDNDCLGDRTGWFPDFALDQAQDQIRAAMPLFRKTNSYGEYIFDWGWAQACAEAGLPYYPKLVAAIPFTPASAPKVLVNQNLDAEDQASAIRDLYQQVWQQYERGEDHSLHILFTTASDRHSLADLPLAERHSLQFHLENPGWADFDDYTAGMQGKRRRQIVRERRQVAEADLRLERLTGDQLVPDQHGAMMYWFYRQTLAKKGAIPYLTEKFFQQVLETMADRSLLVVAYQGDRPVAATINFFKGEHFFGRYWGCEEEFRNLHFELCYYQTLEFVLRRKLRVFEAGAQGIHKLQRGFLPTLTYSAHHLRDERIMNPVKNFLREESEDIATTIADLAQHSPFRTSV